MVSACAIAAAVAVLSAAGPASAQPIAIRPVATTGQPAPGGGTFERFTIESQPVMAPVNNKGQVAFFATLQRAPGSEGLFVATGGRIARAAMEGDPAPGGGTISGFGRHPIPAINEAGTVAFAAAVAGGKAVEGIFTAARGRLQPVALTGAPAPAFPSGTLASLDAPVINDRGEVAFLATVRRGRETVEAIFASAGGKLRKVVAQGDPTPAGGSFAGFGAPALNSKGAIAFAAVVEGRAIPGGVFIAEGGRLRLLLGAGDESPVGGIVTKFAERVALNDAGAVAIHVVLRNAPVAAALLAMMDGRLHKVTALGDPAPGGGTFSHFGPWPAIGVDGGVAFAASVDGGSSPVGVFLARPSGEVVRIAAIGNALPGGGIVGTFTLYPVVGLSPSGTVTFAVAPTSTGEGAEGIFMASTAQGR
jgi:hypothetical protein